MLSERAVQQRAVRRWLLLRFDLHRKVPGLRHRDGDGRGTLPDGQLGTAARLANGVQWLRNLPGHLQRLVGDGLLLRQHDDLPESVVHERDADQLGGVQWGGLLPVVVDNQLLAVSVQRNCLCDELHLGHQLHDGQLLLPHRHALLLDDGQQGQVHRQAWCRRAVQRRCSVLEWNVRRWVLLRRGVWRQVPGVRHRHRDGSRPLPDGDVGAAARVARGVHGHGSLPRDL